MSQSELLKRVVAVLDREGMPYMVTGSFASSAQGEPRASHDIDLVVALDERGVRAIVAAFPPPEFYVSLDAAIDAVRRRSMFNLLWIDTGDKVDFWMLTDEPFDQSRFARRSSQPLLGELFPLSSVEDTILAKLRWCRMSGGSEKQMTDALRVYEVQRTRLDESYLDDWAQRLGLSDLLSSLRSRAVSP